MTFALILIRLFVRLSFKQWDYMSSHVELFKDIDATFDHLSSTGRDNVFIKLYEVVMIKYSWLNVWQF